MILDADKIYAKLIEAGEDWADKDAAANLLEETRKSVFSEWMLNSNASSIAAREAEALVTQAYMQHITQMVEARKESNKARVRYDALKTLAELRRSQESTRRAEANIR